MRQGNCSRKTRPPGRWATPPTGLCRAAQKACENAADALDPEEAETSADVFAAHRIASRAAQEACDQADELVSLAEELNHEIRR